MLSRRVLFKVHYEMYLHAHRLYNRTEQNRNFINLYYSCILLNNTQQTTYKHKVTLYTLTINTLYIYKQYILI